MELLNTRAQPDTTTDRPGLDAPRGAQGTPYDEAHKLADTIAARDGGGPPGEALHTVTDNVRRAVYESGDDRAEMALAVGLLLGWLGDLDGGMAALADADARSAKILGVPTVG